MFRVRWAKQALNQLIAHWTDADSETRQLITAATYQLDKLLENDPWAESESRPDGRRIRFVPPLGVLFRVEANGLTVSVLRMWLFRSRGM